MAFVKIDKSIIDSYCFANPNHLKIWIWLLVKTNWKDRYVSLKIGRGSITVNIKRGEILYGRSKAENELGISGSTIERCLNEFVKQEQITITPNSQYSIITICNYDSYQNINDELEQPMNSLRTDNELDTNLIRTTYELDTNTPKNIKNNKNNKEVKENKDFAKLQKKEFVIGVKLLESENDKLISEYGEQFVSDCYNFLSAYKEEKNYKTKSDYLTIKRWVIDAVKKKNIGKGQSYPTDRPQKTQEMLDDLERYKQQELILCQNKQ